jgi:hypothetical protein
VLDYVLFPSRILENLGSLPLAHDAELVTSSRLLPERIDEPDGAMAVSSLGTFDMPAVTPFRDVHAARLGERLERAIWQSDEHRADLLSFAP